MWCMCVPVWVCAHTCASHGVSVEVRGQLAGVGSLVSCRSQVLNSGHQAWWQPPFPLSYLAGPGVFFLMGRMWAFDRGHIVWWLPRVTDIFISLSFLYHFFVMKSWKLSSYFEIYNISAINCSWHAVWPSTRTSPFMNLYLLTSINSFFSSPPSHLPETTVLSSSVHLFQILYTNEAVQHHKWIRFPSYGSVLFLDVYSLYFENCFWFDT